MRKCIIVSILVSFLISCTSSERDKNTAAQNEIIEQKELNTVQDLIEKDKRKLDSMRKSLKLSNGVED